MGRIVRPAMRKDLAAMLDLADAKRQQYTAYQPVFWRPAPEAHERQETFFQHVLEDERALTFVAERAGAVVGFVIGTLITPPPVYAPGGQTCLVDDFCVANDDWMEIGAALLEAIRTAAYERGAIQIVVISGHLDEAKRAFLVSQELAIASEWWTGPL